MKKTRTDNAKNPPDDLQSEYEFDYRTARPNRFAGRTDPERRVIALDPDVAKVFTTAESVNTLLRALMNAMPVAATKSRVRR